MRVRPRPIDKSISFCTSHLEIWAENAAAIGTTPELVAMVAAATEEAKLARAEKAQLEQAARAATLRAKEAVNRMNRLAQTVVDQVHVAARIHSNAVYQLAGIPVPDKQSPIHEPGEPYRMTVKLEAATGMLTLTWKCDNPTGSRGTTYLISRKIGDADFTQIGSSGVKSFEDKAVPPGTARIVYKVQAMRSTCMGPSATFNVHLGMDPGQPKTVLVVPSKPMWAA